MNKHTSNYKSLFRFAFVPINVVDYARKMLKMEDVMLYLQFSFEKNKAADKIIEENDRAYFNTGLLRARYETIYAYFVINTNKRQKWVLKYLGTAEELNIEHTIETPVCTIEDYNRDFFDFAFAHNDKYQPLLNEFEDLHAAREYIRNVFRYSYQLGYIVYENEQAIFNTGIQKNTNEFFYAVFSKNKIEKPEWYLNGFLTNPIGFSVLPDYYCNAQTPSHRGKITSCTEIPEGVTLLVTAVNVEYEALKNVLKDNNLDYVERVNDSVGNREFSYLYIEKLNTVALLSGQSFECFIPITQAILSFKPHHAVLSGIAFSFDVKRAPLNSVIVSKTVWDYESAKINDNIVNQRGNKIPASLTLRQLFRKELERGMLVKHGDFASGMKIVNSQEYRESITQYQPEVLAGDQEGYFFAHICNEFRVQWIVIKTISDYGADKTDDVQTIAAYSALRYVVKGLMELNI